MPAIRAFRKASVFSLPLPDACFDVLELTEKRGAMRGFWHVLMKRRWASPFL